MPRRGCTTRPDRSTVRASGRRHRSTRRTRPLRHTPTSSTRRPVLSGCLVQTASPRAPHPAAAQHPTTGHADDHPTPAPPATLVRTRAEPTPAGWPQAEPRRAPERECSTRRALGDHQHPRGLPQPWMSVQKTASAAATARRRLRVIDKPDYALVIPLDGDRLHLSSNTGTRWACGGRISQEPPRPRLLPPHELAARELREETGLRAQQLTELGTSTWPRACPANAAKRSWPPASPRPHQREPESRTCAPAGSPGTNSRR